MTENDKLEIIRDILLADERDLTETFANKIESLEHAINTRPELSKRVSPIIEHRLDHFVKDIPRTLGPTITKTLKTEIRKSKTQVVEALYPILGKMVKKYVQQEIKLLSERINKQLESGFSASSWQRRLRAWFGGVKEEDLILSEANRPRVEQVMVIEKNSGILLGSLNKSETIDEDMISGMLTAIKNFVEDAFKQKDQNLELIEYEFYNLHIQNFISYYIVVVISGTYSTVFKDTLQDIIFDLSQNFLSLPNIRASLTREILERELAYYFKNENI